MVVSDSRVKVLVGHEKQRMHVSVNDGNEAVHVSHTYAMDLQDGPSYRMTYFISFEQVNSLEKPNGLPGRKPRNAAREKRFRRSN